MPTDNSTILDRVRLVATNDYQQRIPAVTRGSLARTTAALFDPLNREYWNQFIDILINRIGMTIVRGDQWDNPLAAFKGAKLDYGSTIQEIAPQWIKAHSYDDADETLLKLARPEAAAWYHSQNRRDKYKISINEQELRTAFTDEYGLNNLITKIMQVPYNSDNYDEYRIMLQMIAEYESNWGFYKYGLPELQQQTPDQKVVNEEFLTAIQSFAGKLRFPSQLYNAQEVDIPVFANPDELILLITPDALAGLNVQTLANVFNLELAEIKYRTVIVDEFPIPDCMAILTTRDFFVAHDTLYQTDSFYDPNTLTNHYYLHHWGVYSVSPFVPAICIGKYTTTSIDSVTLNMDEPNAMAAIKYFSDINGDVNTVNPFTFMGVNPSTWTQSQIEDIINDTNIDFFTHDLSVGEIYTNTPAEQTLGSVAYQPFVRGFLTNNTTNADLNSLDSAFTNCIGHVVKATVVGGKIVEGAFVADATVTPLNSRTFVDSDNVLHIQKTRNGWSNNSALQVTFTLQYNDPSDSVNGDETFTATSLITFAD